jgi:hypothetical protein
LPGYVAGAVPLSYLRFGSDCRDEVRGDQIQDFRVLAGTLQAVTEDPKAALDRHPADASRVSWKLAYSSLLGQDFEK